MRCAGARYPPPPSWYARPAPDEHPGPRGELHLVRVQVVSGAQRETVHPGPFQAGLDPLLLGNDRLGLLNGTVEGGQHFPNPFLLFWVLWKSNLQFPQQLNTK